MLFVHHGCCAPSVVQHYLVKKHIEGVDDEIDIDDGTDDARGGAVDTLPRIAEDETTAARLAAAADLSALQEDGMLPVIPTKRQKNAALGTADARLGGARRPGAVVAQPVTLNLGAGAGAGVGISTADVNVRV